jgi:hypothetical protein
MKATFPSVQLYKDVDGGVERADMLLARNGIDILGAAAGRLSVGEATPAIRVSNANRRVITSNVRNWPALEADINIVITRNPIFADKTELSKVETRTGMTVRASRNTNVAIVHADETLKTLPRYVAHYGGRLLLAYGDPTAKKSVDFCDDGDCLLSEKLEPAYAPQDDALSALKGMFEKIVSMDVGDVLNSRPGNTATGSLPEQYCGDCTADLRTSATRLFTHHNGLAPLA